MRIWGLPLLAVCLAATAVHAEPASDDKGAAWYGAYDRDSRLVPVGEGRGLNLYCLGEGAPTVVLEPGIGETAYTWWKVQSRIAATTRVCAYDRAGMGKSPPGPEPRDTAAEVADLEAMLKAGGVAAPYVLVGHSMGGYNARLFASLHSSYVVGMVLIDPSVENQLPIMETALPNVKKNDERSEAFLATCADPKLAAADFEARCVRAAPSTFSPELATKYLAAQSPAHYRAFVSEVDGFLHRDSDEVIAQRHSFGSMPLIVLTRGQLSTDMPKEDAETERKLWTGLHDQVVTLSTDGSNRIVADSGHYIQLDQPDAVVSAIAEVVAKARSARR